MRTRYNDTTAKHYAAYRPELHNHILGLALGGRNEFRDGLDVGCGTGCSSLALAEYCRKVVAVDPSQPMLDRAVQHARISYAIGSAERLPSHETSFDLVTFAGSFGYVRPEVTSRELHRVCRDDVLIVCYDFEVSTDDVLIRLGIESDVNSHNYRTNPSDIASLKMTNHECSRIQLDITPINLAHLLLSNAERHKVCSKHFKMSDPIEILAQQLDRTEISGVHAEICYSTFQLIVPHSIAHSPLLGGLFCNKPGADSHKGGSSKINRISFETTTTLSDQDDVAIQSGLQAFNIAEGRIDEVMPLSIVARDENNEVIGGLIARTWGLCCEMMIVWVREDCRKQGIGRRLMAEVENSARSRGCELIYLDTFSFQAPAFYTSFGYTTNHATEGYPHGIQKFHMSKDLTVSKDNDSVRSAGDLRSSAPKV